MNHSWESGHGFFFLYNKMCYISLKQFLLPWDTCASMWRPVLSELPKGRNGLSIGSRWWMGAHLYVHLCSPQTSHTKIFCLHGNDILYITYNMCYMQSIRTFSFAVASSKNIEGFALVQCPKKLPYLSQHLLSNWASYINGWHYMKLSETLCFWVYRCYKDHNSSSLKCYGTRVYANNIRWSSTQSVSAEVMCLLMELLCYCWLLVTKGTFSIVASESQLQPSHMRAQPCFLFSDSSSSALQEESQ